MSTFAVSGMTRDAAVAEAKKTVKTTRPDPKNLGQKADQIMRGSR